MANNLIALVDGETVELEGEALNELLAAQESATAKLNAEKAEAQSRALAKAELLNKLGITAEEASLLLS